MAAALQVTNLSAGQSIRLETSALPGGALQLNAVGGASGPGNLLNITDAMSDAGVSLTATATAGAMGISRTAGTSLALVGQATSASAETDKALWVFSLPNTYLAGAAIPVSVNAVVTGSGTLTAASTTLTLAVYSEVTGVETALTVTGGSQQFSTTAGTLTWSVAGTGLTPGSKIAVEVTMLVTSATGVNVGQLNAISYQA